MTITENVLSKLKKIKFEWTSDGSGDAEDTTTNDYTGKIKHLVTVPDGVATPDDNYDIVITDSDGVDVLNGAGANRDTANTEQVTETSLGIVGYSKLTCTISNAGDTKQGTVYLYIEE